MKIIISPAKKMNVDTDVFGHTDLPVFLSRTKELMDYMKGLSFSEAKKLWSCNDKIAEQNFERYARMNLERGLTPAIISYEGIQYQYMAPGVFSDQEFSYVQNHLRILSGFYGVLKPFDGVTPYRLEMQAKLGVGKSRDLYDYWADSLAMTLCRDSDCIINLASKEYSACISNHLPDSIRFITCVFGEVKDGKIIEKGTMCKMARGEMVRYMAENRIEDPDKIKEFSRLDYRYSAEDSDSDKFVFIKKATGG